MVELMDRLVAVGSSRSALRLSGSAVAQLITWLPASCRKMVETTVIARELVLEEVMGQGHSV